MYSLQSSIFSMYKFLFVGCVPGNASILLTKTTAVRNEAALRYHKVRGLYFLAVVLVATIVILRRDTKM